MNTVMIEKVQITKTSLKEGVSKDNKPYTKLGLQVDKYGEKWLGCFLSEFNKSALLNLKEGQTVDLLITQSGDFLNFKLPGVTDKLEVRVSALERDVQSLLKASDKTPEYNPEDLNPDDIPF